MLGHVTSDDLVDMFRFTVANETVNVSITLKPWATTEALACRLIVLDEEGRILHDGPFPSDGAGMTVNIQPAKGTSTSTMVVGVVADGPRSEPSDAPSPDHYELLISQEDSPELPPPTPPEEPPPPPPPPETSTPDTEIPTPQAPDWIVRGMDEGEFLVGPLPVHSAGPLGGILTDLVPLQTLDWVDAALVDFPRVDSPLPGMSGDVEDGGAGEEGHLGKTRRPLIVLEGPGGFPILAAASVVSRPPLDDAKAVACLPELRNSIGQASTTGAVASRTVESREGNRPTRRSSIALTLHLAVLLATGLLFPDFITVRGDREVRRRPRLRVGARGRRDDRALTPRAPSPSPSEEGGPGSSAQCQHPGEPSRPLGEAGGIG